MKKVLVLGGLILGITILISPLKTHAIWQDYNMEEYLDSNSLLISDQNYSYIIETSYECDFYSNPVTHGVDIDVDYSYSPYYSDELYYSYGYGNNYYSICYITNYPEALNLFDLNVSEANTAENYFITQIEDTNYLVEYGYGCSSMPNGVNLNYNISFDSDDGYLTPYDTIYLFGTYDGWQSCYITNIEEVDEISPTASASPNGGTYTSNQFVYLSANDDRDLFPDIYYTTNGSTPTEYSNHYYSSVYITETTILKFIAIDDWGNESQVYTENYIINEEVIPPPDEPDPDPNDESIANPDTVSTHIDKVSGVKIKKIKKKSAKIKWKKVSQSDVTYKIQIKKLNKKGKYKLYKKSTTNKNKKKIKKLKSGKNYKVRVRAKSEATKGKWSKWKKFKTK